jgi:TRAP-type uncharacterized transport system substrate-binding protein
MEGKNLRGWRRLQQPGRAAAVSWRDLLVVAAPVLALVGAVIWVAVALVRPAPPDTIRMLGGAEGSGYRTNAERYKAIIERYGVKVQVVPSRGSLDNLQRLANPRDPVDVGFVQSGLTEG